MKKQIKIKNIFKIILGSVLFALIGMLFSCKKQAPTEITKLRIGGHTTILGAPLTIAKEKGFYADEGLDVEIMYVRSSKHSMAAMEGGNLDIVIGSTSAGSFNMLSKGSLKIIADAARIIPSVIIRKDLWDSKTITDLQSLKDRTIRVPREGSASYYALSKILSSVALTIEDVKPKFLNENGAIAAIEAKNLEAAILNEPYATNAVEKGIGIRYDIAKISSIFPENWQQHMLLYTTERMITNSAILKKFLKAYIKSVRVYEKARKGIEPERSEVIKIISKYTGMEPQIIERSLWPHVDIDGKPDIEYLNEMQDYFFKKGLIDKKIDLLQFIDLRFLR